LETDNIQRIFISFFGVYRKSSKIYHKKFLASYTFPEINKIYIVFPRSHFAIL